MSNPNPSPSTRFKKGDPRINRKGKPKSFDALRTLAQQIAHEEAQSQGQPIIFNGKKATVTEMILRQWASSKNYQLQKAFMEIAFGKVPDALDVTSGGEKLVIEVIYGNDGTDSKPA